MQSTLKTFESSGKKYSYFSLPELGRQLGAPLSKLPVSIRIVLESVLRNCDGKKVTEKDVRTLAAWNAKKPVEEEIPFVVARIVLQDFTGVPLLVDLAAMRTAVSQMGKNPAVIEPLVPVDLVVDHSVQVDVSGSPESLERNMALEMERNRERYEFMKWGQQAFSTFKVVPPGVGIVHQVNLEYLAKGVLTGKGPESSTVVYPDTLVGTDSHTTMINGVGVVGWGVGGIEAEAGMLGQPIYFLTPEVVGVNLKGAPRAGVTATDIVLTLTEMLRKAKVVGKFVEYYGDGAAALSVADRATIANMAPEYGATMGFFPIDDETITYLRHTGRDEHLISSVERYAKENLLWRDPSAKLRFSDTLGLDLATVVPSIAGPKRPQDRVPLSTSRRAWRRALCGMLGEKAGDAAAQEAWATDGGGTALTPGAAGASAQATTDRGTFTLRHGDVVIAAITSCTNTSNPAVMLAAGLLARKAVARGLKSKPWVKTSLAPGSQVVTEYFKAASVMDDLEALGFHLVGYGCTTCIGNSGPVHDDIARAVKDGDLVVASVLSGNRNFEGRVNPVVKANYLASPPLVVAYALAGTMNIDMEKEALGIGTDGAPVFLRDVWPTPEEIAAALRHVTREQFVERYAAVTDGGPDWKALPVPTGNTFAWDASSTYIRKPSFFDDLQPTPAPLVDVKGARALAILGDSVTTDHISPAGNIAKGSPAAKYLAEHGVPPAEYNQYGARRGNHEVMVRGTFANIRLKNLMVPGVEGGVTRHLPSNEQMSIYDAAMRYQTEGMPLVVLAGEEYGTGSSRDWAAKGTLLLGVRAVIAKSFERIHRSNLIGMGVLPAEFEKGQDASTLELTGDEIFTIEGIAGGLSPKKRLTVRANDKTFTVIARVDTPQEVEYLAHGGILQYVLRNRAAQVRGA